MCDTIERHAFSRAPLWFPHSFYVNQFYVEDRGETDVGIVDCDEETRKEEGLYIL